jgi:activator of 2-hydroxyglutaryl-CoA dehydratase
LYNVLIESFEGAESEVIDFIINGIEIDEIKKSLADSIKKNYYSSNQTEKSVTASKSKTKEVPTE